MVRVCQEDFPKGHYPLQRGDGFPIDGILKTNLDFMKQRVILRKMDVVVCCDGKVGVGKSTLAFQLAKYLDNSFCLDRVVFTPQQFLEALKVATKGQAVVFDEAMIINSRYAMSEFNKSVITMMAQVRSKQLFIFFVLPSVFDLDRNLILHRTDLMLHCYTEEFGRRGYFNCYFENRIKLLYLLGKKFYSYAKPRPNHPGTFSRCFVLDEIAYEKKKQEAINSLIRTPGPKKDVRFKKQRDNLIKFIRDNYKISYPQIAEACGDIGEKEVGQLYRGKR